MIGYFVIILLAAGSVLAAALFFRHRQKQVMDGLSDMLEAAINGTFSETTFDESRQSSLENRLAQYLAASELSVRSIDVEREKIKELIADISHQTRTPLSNILLYTELLEEEPLGEAAQDSVKKLRQQSEKLQFLMDALVKLSRLETGVFVLHPIRQPLTELVVDGMESYREKAAAKGLAIAFSGTKKAEKDAPVYAYFDKKWSMEALGNILDNAIKYTNTGGITIKLCSYELFACVEVTDTGIGIGEEEHAAVFGRFYRENAVAEKAVWGSDCIWHVLSCSSRADISGFRPCRGKVRRLGCIFRQQLCQNCKNLLSPGQILERILCDNLKRRQEMPNQEQKEITGWSFWKPEI